MEKVTEKSLLNWVAADLFSDNAGFLLTDALISVFIVSVMASLTASALICHYHVRESVHQEIRNQEKKDTHELMQIRECELCEESPEPSETPVE